MTRYLWGVMIGVIGVVSFGVTLIAWEKSQRQDIEHEVARTLKAYRGEQRGVILTERLIQAQEQARVWQAIASQHANDVTAKKTLEFWNGEVERLQQKLRER